jgi:hypothetical protein
MEAALKADETEPIASALTAKGAPGQFPRACIFTSAN